jgi:uncharacterized DUF497 family protein
MKALCMILLAAAHTAAADTPGPARVEEVLAQLQQVLAKAWVAGDRATIERVIAPDWTTTGPDGTVRTLQERRFVTIGVSGNGRVLVVAHADRRAAVRIISARRATPRERRFCEKGE